MKTIREKTIGNKYIILVYKSNENDYKLTIFRKGMEKGLMTRVNYYSKEVLNDYNTLNGIKVIENYIKQSNNQYTDDIDFDDPMERANFEIGLQKRYDGGWE